ncbi:hypothetical protein [Hydrogenophaga sp.]|uniref:hypothetical protein n=1 Tax=Hydrogenophaga sp. TaxID=1904254 RepID=UPI002718A445|nr:hypothetical protein [Hydrogenophaga sp.]MDO8905797.1 hypothetical protein [Hydrogenophaga sp.]
MRVATKVRATVLAAAVGILTACGGGGDTDVTQATAKAWEMTDEGTGFVGKGDVQVALNLNNKMLQDNASKVTFRTSSTTVTEVSWICTNTNNQSTQERERTTTTTSEGIVTSVARERNQVTGFILSGYGAGQTTTTSTDGPPLNSCPNNWVLTPAGDPVTVGDPTFSPLQVSIDGEVWKDLI